MRVLFLLAVASMCYGCGNKHKPTAEEAATGEVAVVPEPGGVASRPEARK